MDDTSTSRIARTLRDHCEPIASMAYFVPETRAEYSKLGFEDFWEPYYCSRGGCLGPVSGEMIAAAFGVFNPDVVVPAVARGWTRTDAPTILKARQDGSVAALRRMLGDDADPSGAVAILRPVMESVALAGRPLFSGLRSLPFPDEPLGQLWRVCDLVRERRGDGHVGAWISAGLDPIEIGLLTEAAWGMQLNTYIRSRGWTQDQILDGIARLEDRGLLKAGQLTELGRTLREDVEVATDAADRDVVTALGDRADELMAMLRPWAAAVLEQNGYPRGPLTITS